jgi:hypothetical protein
VSLSIEWGEAPDQSRQLATGAGWSAFGLWADTLDPTVYREVVHLWEHGYTRKPDALVLQLEAALTRVPPGDSTVHATAEHLLTTARAAKGADHLAVDLGFGPDDGHDEWDQDADEYDPHDSDTRESKVSSLVREDHGAPPWPGAVFDDVAHRWKNPHTGEEHGDNAHAGPHTTAPGALHHATAAHLVGSSKVPLSDEKKVEYAGHVAAVLHRMPEGARARALAALAGGTVNFHPDLPALAAAAEKLSGHKIKSMIGGFVEYKSDFHSCDLHLDGGSNPPLTAPAIGAHEMWHLTDLRTGQETGTRLTDDPAWRRAWKSEISNGRAATQKGLSAYAATNEKEGFAELGREIHELGVAAVETVRPKCVAFLRAKGLL